MAFHLYLCHAIPAFIILLCSFFNESLERDISLSSPSGLQGAHAHNQKEVHSETLETCKKWNCERNNLTTEGRDSETHQCQDKMPLERGMC